MYYNYPSGINYPSPLMYAKKLSKLVGNVLSDDENIGSVSEKIHNQIKGLYYIWWLQK